jgi:hypothetical protein
MDRIGGRLVGEISFWTGIECCVQANRLEKIYSTRQQVSTMRGVHGFRKDESMPFRRIKDPAVIFVGMK